MKHIPERHQSVVPPPSIMFTIFAILALMVVIYVSVSLAAD